MIKKNCAVFISGKGSNLESLIKENNKEDFPIEIKLIISDKSNAEGLKYSKIYNINCLPLDYLNFEDKKDFEIKLLDFLTDNDIEIICLAGYMQILSSFFIQSFEGPILNIHPSLLPKYKGLNTHQRALDNNDKLAGCTVHYVSENVDSGEIILQKSLNINEDDTCESLQKRVLKLEHQVYSDAIRKIFTQTNISSSVKN